jgi:hypothetical protein
MGKGEGDCQLHPLVIVISSLALQKRTITTAKQMMKAFIDSCRARGKGYFPSESEGEAEVFCLVLDLEVQLNCHTAIEDSPLPTTTSIKSIMLPTSQSTIPCRHTGCNKKFSTMSNRNKHEAACHARAVTEARQSIEEAENETHVLYPP